MFLYIPTELCEFTGNYLKEIGQIKTVLEYFNTSVQTTWMSKVSVTTFTSSRLPSSTVFAALSRETTGAVRSVVATAVCTKSAVFNIVSDRQNLVVTRVYLSSR